MLGIGRGPTTASASGHDRNGWKPTVHFRRRTSARPVCAPTRPTPLANKATTKRTPRKPTSRPSLLAPPRQPASTGARKPDRRTRSRAATPRTHALPSRGAISNAYGPAGRIRDPTPSAHQRAHDPAAQPSVFDLIPSPSGQRPGSGQEPPREPAHRPRSHSPTPGV